MQPETIVLKVMIGNAIMETSTPSATLNDEADSIDPSAIESNSGSSLWDDDED